MRHPVAYALVPVLVLALLVVSAPAHSQEATPAAEEGLPPGVFVDVLAEVIVDELPSAPAEIAFFRFAFAPGAGFPLDSGDPSLALVYVERGTLTVNVTTEVRVTRVAIEGTPVAVEVAAAGAAFGLGPGESVIFPPFAAGEVVNAGTEPVEVLVLNVFPLGAEGEATPEAATPAAAASPVAAGEEEFELPEGISFEPLAFGEASELPAGPALLVIGRFALAEGAGIPQHPHPGAELGFVESGTVAFQTSEGPALQVMRDIGSLATPGAEPTTEEAGPGQEVTVEAGDALFIPPGNVSDIRNVGQGEALALFAEIVPLTDEATPMASPAT